MSDNLLFPAREHQSTILGFIILETGAL
jgi:hypothetical protein